jgi:hypothetical protein
MYCKKSFLGKEINFFGFKDFIVWRIIKGKI